MSDFCVESVFLNVAPSRAWEYLRNPLNLSQWTNAFRSVSGSSALMVTPKGQVHVGLGIVASQPDGTVDWKMTFPDGSESWAWSRIVSGSVDCCFYSVVLPRPPAELDQIEGDLATQKGLLREELKRLKRILEKSANE